MSGSSTPRCTESAPLVQLAGIPHFPLVPTSQNLSKLSPVCVIFFGFILLSTQARWHNHTKHSKHNHPHKISYISQPPSSSPGPAASYSPPPELEEPKNPYNSTPGVFDVRLYGAVGDGQTDDTQAFKMAWDTACQSESPAKILVPNHLTFMIHSTIFTGPCLSGLVLQLIMLMGL
ncbi:hypothetical protein ACLB2K_006760 [Fragaria x ananassa]